MAAKKTKRAKSKKNAKKKIVRRDYVVVTDRGYGNALKGSRIYFEGRKPKRLQDNGRIPFGKHILEYLNNHFKEQRYRWIITKETDEIRLEYGIYRVRTSERFLNQLTSESFQRGRDIKNDIVRSHFGSRYPEVFPEEVKSPYVPGRLADILDKDVIKRMSSEDKEALLDFLPDFLSSEAASSVSTLKAEAELESLREVVNYLEENISKTHSEHWWQTYIRKHILIIQQGYIKALEKLNVSIGDTKLPDFALVTHDMYLDVLEIKKPNTNLLKEDTSRNNFYWDTEMSKAVSQTENYLEKIGSQRDTIRSFLKDTHKLDMQVLKPRGLILAGDTRQFGSQKERDDFRILSSGLKNLSVVTYDELVSRMKNYIAVLEEHGAGSKKRVKKSTKKKSKTNKHG